MPDDHDIFPALVYHIACKGEPDSIWKVTIGIIVSVKERQLLGSMRKVVRGIQIGSNEAGIIQCILPIS